ncbi:HAMP domain-containing sensor histidine kinase [Ruminococcus sp.]|uniref:sensor histidine kinase n=1 Tax=Ruminococcus sp. TaxID=41978 RepID=UPI0025DF89AB|nr:HAMP domain-containing sensor histidine kinase [Ruminococcus sp.]MBQ8966913.1 HAMP domain-containing histidine kinase [Ruminococcus sp.]
MSTRSYVRIGAAAAAAVLCLILHTPVGCCIVLGGLGAFLVGEGIVTDIRRKRRLTELIDYITRVQDDLTLSAPECSDEGLTGILQSEIYKVVALLREQYSAEKNQKEYMSDMLSDISHQIKTPLTAIQLMTELLEQPDLEEDKRLQYAEKIDSQVGRITWLIRNLLTLSQLEAGVLKMKLDDVNIGGLMEDIRSSLEIMAEVKGVSLEVKVPDTELKADRHWLREALMNVIKNCIEHTDEGGYVRVTGTENNLCTELTIEDNGSGISEKDLPHIFERFYKADNSSPQSVGIGLALAKNIISAHSGIIEVESEKGRGTKFRVKIYAM